MSRSSKQYQPSQADIDNRSRQLNSEHDAYWQSRGEEGRPSEEEVDTQKPQAPAPATPALK
ncbi:hypothetical protein HRD49_37060 [Corallococcus exiguus]|uniref:hypothetical protein n=1 Tax=Corallococcus TaxID=83461 RepID=UPI000EA0C187|nr:MULTISPECIES: hypothetical protein [Corallococcus]NNC14761.1 hypothetical protein [Corallococcus exiguus]NRD53750.1 hypothetical protein [Corallococcus exiguus]NRD67363.1 hypothetical protein [Corallococcus exiguus]RKH30657.1 hypothetical protein D7V77_02260 [Corallococcus sp. CA041A]RKI14965.1 hypothetical protein D7Y15_14375 [Corallococcus sp. AB030]